AVALAERDDGAVAVGEQLDLDMARPLEVALEEHGVVAEGRRSLAPGGLHGIAELRGGAHDAHAAAPASGGGLHEQRKPDLVRRSARQHRHAGGAGGLFRRELVSARAQRRRRRADPHEARGEHGLGQLGALGEEAVPGMHRVRTRLPRGAHVLAQIEIRGDLDHRIRRARVQRAEVVGGDDGGGRETLLAAGAEDAERNLASVRHQHPLHASSVAARGEPVRYPPAASVTRKGVIAALVLLVLGLGAGVARAATVVVVTGHGWGHGVGMSQWGARGYALHGWDWQRIVAHYYPGTRVSTTANVNMHVLLAASQPGADVACAAGMRVGDATGRTFALPADSYH